MSRKWLPLAPVGTAGIWSQLFNMVPTRCGSYYPGNRFAPNGTAPALATPGTTNRAWCALYGNDSVVGYVGTDTKIYQYDGLSTYTDRSSAAYTGGARAWQFCQFGNITLASNRADTVQFRDVTAGGNFANLAAAPKANILVTQSSQVLAFDLNIGGTEYRNAFATCAPGDYTDWSSANATINTPITARPGKITAACAFRDYVLVFKQSSVYKLTYTGSSTYKWRVECIAIGKGAWAPFDVVPCGEFVIFSGPGGAWKFDGATFTGITDYVGEIPFASASWFAPLSQNVMLYDLSHNATYVYNAVSDQWGQWQTISTSATVAQGPMATAVHLMGEPAAIRAFIAPTAALPDLAMVIGSDLSTDGAYTSTAYMGITGQSVGTKAYLTTGAEGLGGRQQTKFGPADLDTTISIARTGDIGPPATALSLGYIVADNKEAYAFVSSNPSTSTASSTSQHRFDFQKTAPYATFQISFPSVSGGYLEILDINLNMKPGGML